MLPFGAPERLIIFHLLFCAEINQIKVHQSCLHRLYRSCWCLTFVMQEGPFLLIWRKQKFETISLIIFKYFLMVDGINNDISASSFIQWVYKPWFDEIQQFVSNMMSTEQITYSQLSYQYSRILWSSLAFGIFLLSLFRRFEGSESTFTLELATVNAQTISDVSGLTKQYDFPNNW